MTEQMEPELQEDNDSHIGEIHRIRFCITHWLKINQLGHHRGRWEDVPANDFLECGYAGCREAAVMWEKRFAMDLGALRKQLEKWR